MACSTRLRLPSAFLVIATIGGCFTLTGDVDAILGGEAGDAGRSSFDREVAEGSTSSDAGAGRDASVGDAGAGAQDAATPDDGGSFCAMLGGAHALCDDFDVDPLGARWSGLAQITGGTVTLAATSVKSAPLALRTTLPSGCSNASAQLLRTVVGKPAHLDVGFDVRLGSTPATELLNLVGVVYPTSVGEYRVDVGFRVDRLVLVENDVGGAGFAALASSDATHGKDVWQRVDVAFIFTPPPARVVVKVEGVGRIDHAISPREPSSPTARLDFGLYAQSGCGAVVDARFDNVLVDFAAK